jgi:NADH-quinone oxidoreductase subunit J
VADFLFYALSAAAVLFGVGVISAKQPMMSVLSLLGSFVCLAGIYLLAQFQFLAAAQILVYAGAIMVLFLFVVMLLDLSNPQDLRELPGKVFGKKRGVLAVLVAFGLFLTSMLGARAALGLEGIYEPREGAYDPLQGIAELFFTRYLLLFEAGALLLLATMVGVMVLAKRQRGELTRQG